MSGQDPRARLYLEAVRRGERAFASFRGDIQGIIGRVASLTAGYLSLRAASAAVTRSFKDTSGLIATSDRLGIATDQLESFRFAAAETAKLGETTFDTALQRMARRIAEAATGSGEASGAIRELGLDARELGKLPLADQFAAVADAMQRVDGQGDKIRLSFKLFDSEGVAVVNTLRLGSKGLDDYRDEATKLGIALSRVDAEKIEIANEAVRRGQAAIRGIANTFAVEAAPAVVAIANAFLDARDDVDDMGGVARKAIDGIAAAAGVVADALYGWQIIIAGTELAWLKFEERLSNWQEEYRESGFFAAMREASRKLMPELVDELEKAGAFTDSNAEAEHEAAVAAEEHLRALIAAERPSEKIAAALERARIETEREAEARARAAAEIITPSGGTSDVSDQARQRAERGLQQTRQVLIKGLEEELELRRQYGQINAAQDRELREQIATERADSEREALRARLQMLVEARQAELITDKRFKELSIELSRQTEAKISGITRDGLTEREKFEQLSAQKKAEFVLGSLQTITAGVSSSNKRLFQLNKVAAISNAIVYTAEAVTRALDSADAPYNFFLAAAVAAAGYAQIQQIRATTFGGGTTPSAAGTTSQVNGQPIGAGSVGVEAFATGSGGQTSRSSARIEVNVYGPVIGAGGRQELGEYLTTLLRDYTDSTDDVIISDRSRNAQQIRGG